MINQIRKYCLNVLESSVCKDLAFHNIDHTREVVLHIEHIASIENISDEETEIVLIAGYFHDVGFSSAYEGHEELSARMAASFLNRIKYPDEKIQGILNCILATKMPQNPQSQLEEIICDADLYHTGMDNFFYRNLLLRFEWEKKCNQVYSDKEWYEDNLKFLNRIDFHTPFGKSILFNGKMKNIAKLEKLIDFYNNF